MHAPLVWTLVEVARLLLSLFAPDMESLSQPYLYTFIWCWGVLGRSYRLGVVNVVNN